MQIISSKWPLLLLPPAPSLKSCPASCLLISLSLSWSQAEELHQPNVKHSSVQWMALEKLSPQHFTAPVLGVYSSMHAESHVGQKFWDCTISPCRWGIYAQMLFHIKNKAPITSQTVENIQEIDFFSVTNWLFITQFQLTRCLEVILWVTKLLTSQPLHMCAGTERDCALFLSAVTGRRINIPNMHQGT